VAIVIIVVGYHLIHPSFPFSSPPIADLIRHGKNHHAASKTQPAEATPDSPSSTDNTSRSAPRSTQPSSKHHQSTAAATAAAAAQPQPAASQPRQSQPQQDTMKKEQVREQAVAQNVPVNGNAKSTDYSREVEAIVQEEREAKNKMPTYKGLENFKLLDKMGE
jgi:serine/threonine-protein kinase RCK2